MDKKYTDLDLVRVVQASHILTKMNMSSRILTRIYTDDVYSTNLLAFDVNNDYDGRIGIQCIFHRNTIYFVIDRIDRDLITLKRYCIKANMSDVPHMILITPLLIAFDNDDSFSSIELNKTYINKFMKNTKFIDQDDNIKDILNRYDTRDMNFDNIVSLMRSIYKCDSLFK